MNKIGVIISYRPDTDLKAKILEAQSIGLESCQLSIWTPSLFTAEEAAKIKGITRETGFEISALWSGWTGPCEWNFTHGPITIGLVPEAYRGIRTQELCRASDFAEMLGVRDIITHVGFLPNNPNDPDYLGTIGALRYITGIMEKRSQRFLFETGQETPVTLLRAISDIGRTNVGINLDTANLILYGMANTLDALDVFGQYVMNTHIKDGVYPTEPRMLGKEVQAGKGKANIPATVKRLLELGYEGHFTIEREISGEQQRLDIIETIAFLKSILNGQ